MKWNYFLQENTVAIVGYVFSVHLRSSPSPTSTAAATTLAKYCKIIWAGLNSLHGGGKNERELSVVEIYGWLLLPPNLLPRRSIIVHALKGQSWTDAKEMGSSTFNNRGRHFKAKLHINAQRCLAFPKGFHPFTKCSHRGCLVNLKIAPCVCVCARAQMCVTLSHQMML